MLKFIQNFATSGSYSRTTLLKVKDPVSAYIFLINMLVILAAYFFA